MELNVELTKEEWVGFNEAVEYSPLLSFFLSYLFGNSAMSLMSNIELYHAILRVIRCFASRKETAMLNGNIDGLYKSIRDSVADNVEVANDLDEEEDEILNEANYKNFAGKKESHEEKKLIEAKKREKNDEDDSNKASKLVVDLKNAFNDALKDINESLIKSKKGQDQDNNSTGNLKSMSSLIPDNNEDHEDMNIYTLYKGDEKASIWFHGYEDGRRRKNYAHHYTKEIAADISGKISKSRDKRVNRELKSLNRDLPIHFGSTIAIDSVNHAHSS